MTGPAGRQTSCPDSCQNRKDLRIRILVRGIVQGVGFRPFLHRLAQKLALTGWARNTSGGLEAELEGKEADLASFVERVRTFPPPMAVVEEVSVQGPWPAAGYQGFSILESALSDEATLLSPDMAPCPACRAELFSKKDRRYRYPFLNCTDCGPRYSIVRALPYDRKNTVMDRFPMCPDCLAEYGDIRSRRYHAQPDCCGRCGPGAFFLDAQGKEIPGDPVVLSQRLLACGGIVAVKGTGGIHLACDARSAAAVARLRRRKNRPARPLALMCKDLALAEEICLLSEQEKRLLSSPRAPILLARKRRPQDFCDVSFSPRLGILLPYTPLHLLLTDQSFGGPDLLVMTSANASGCPVLTDNETAVCVLSGIADGFLLHDRPIQNRCDDSLLMEVDGEPYFFRRSRGYAPQPLLTDGDVSGICAFGAEQKASFALGRQNHVFLSPHIGDLKNLETLEHYETALETFCRLFRISPSYLVCDLHPDYFSTGAARSLAQKKGLPLLQVQHHWAHMASCMADNRLDGPVFGIVWDGAGLGEDGTVWGAEFLEGDFHSFRRLGSIRPVRLPGGDRATQEIGRLALSLLWDAGLLVGEEKSVPLDASRFRAVSSLLDAGLSCPSASSMGRLLDGFCALLLGTGSVSYEGEGPARLEAVAVPNRFPGRHAALPPCPWPLSFEQTDGLRRFDFRPLVQAAVSELKEGRGPGEIAGHLLLSLCHMAQNQCIALNPGRLPVVLSGGVFQNRFLLDGVTALLTDAGFRVFRHRRTAPNDEGICLGQLSIAAANAAASNEKGCKHVPCHTDEN